MYFFKYTKGKYSMLKCKYCCCSVLPDRHSWRTSLKTKNLIELQMSIVDSWCVIGGRMNESLLFLYSLTLYNSVTTLKSMVYVASRTLKILTYEPFSYFFSHMWLFWETVSIKTPVFNRHKNRINIAYRRVALFAYQNAASSVLKLLMTFRI